VGPPGTGGSGDVLEAPLDGKFYARINGAWAAIVATLQIDKTPPSLRGSSALYYNGSTASVPFPAGSTVGDTAFLFGGHGYDVRAPTGWTTLSNLSGANYNGNVSMKVLTADDIAAGFAVQTTGGSYLGVSMMAVLVGAVAYRDPIASSRNGGGEPSVLLNVPIAEESDLVLTFATNRGNSLNSTSFSDGALQSISQSESSGFLGAKAVTTTGPFSASFTYVTPGSGNYQAAVVLKGVAS
jgi:hypothetical protein